MSTILYFVTMIYIKLFPFIINQLQYNNHFIKHHSCPLASCYRVVHSLLPVSYYRMVHLYLLHAPHYQAIHSSPCIMLQSVPFMPPCTMLQVGLFILPCIMLQGTAFDYSSLSLNIVS